MSMRPSVAALALAGLLLAPSAQAAACWQAAEIGAARINELETLLMTTSLRCRSIGIDFRDEHDRMVASYNPMFAAAQDRLKVHYGAKTAAGRQDFQRYITTIANRYGTGQVNAATCQRFQIIHRELVNGPANHDLLATIAMAMVRDPWLDAPRCPATQVSR